MILLSEISTYQRLHRHSDAIHYNTEFDQADDYGQSDQSGLSVAA